MSRIRHLSIRRFRGISHLDWAPRAGINALIGPGDVGKSTILAAIGLALSSSRRDSFFDTDFYNLKADQGFTIKVTLGELPEELWDVDRYGQFLRGWDAATSSVEDEPSASNEDVFTLQLAVGPDLEGVWSLYSDRTQDDDPRDLSLAHRGLVAPTVLDHAPDTHLRWTRQSILQRLATPEFAARRLVAQAARIMREHDADLNLGAETEAVVEQVRLAGRELGIAPAQEATVQLDAFGIPGWSATLGLHDADGVPLRRMGTGSARLLVSGLFHSRLSREGIALVDEVEHGLEPHRIARLLRLLGTGSTDGPQVFLTSHSPVVIKELSASELTVVLKVAELECHEVLSVPASVEDVDVQGLVRACPESLLAPNVLVAEGPTEVGLVRGLDVFWSSLGQDSLALRGIAVADGGGIPKAAARAKGFAKLGYRSLLLMDDDRPLAEGQRAPLIAAGGTILNWGGGHSIEEALFAHLAWPDVERLIALAVAIWSREVVDQHIRSHSNGQATLDAALAADTSAHRSWLGQAAKNSDWFKRTDHGIRVGAEVLGPGLARAGAELQATIGDLRAWIMGG